MELVLCQTCHIFRRAGKRWINSKRNYSSMTIYEETRQRKAVVYEKTNCSSLLDVIKKTERLQLHIPDNFKTKNLFWVSLNVLHRKRLLRNPCKTFAVASHREVHTVDAIKWLSSSEIVEMLEKEQLAFRKGYTGFWTSCFGCCDRTTHNMSMFINSRNGKCVCRECGVTLDWSTFKDKNQTSSRTKAISIVPMSYTVEHETPERHKLWCESESTGSEIMSTSFPLDKMSLAVLKKFNVRTSICATNKTDACLIFPYYDITKTRLIGFKKIVNGETSVIVKATEHLSLFGWHLINANQRHVVLTSNELDCIAIAQSTDIPSLALPLGASVLPPDVLPYLEQFDHIIFWFRDEYRAKHNLHRFAAKLSLSRCSMVSPNAGALTVLNKSGSETVEQFVEERRNMGHEQIFTFKELSCELHSELTNARENAGVRFTRFPVLNEYLKGHRRGELTIFTGATGSGKTTFLSELSLDLCMQGVNTLWGSFEIKNIRLANIMLHQYSGIALENHMHRFAYWSEQFENLPMYFMNFYGARDLNEVIETIEYAVYTYDIEHVIIDNLQFMTLVGNGEDRFQLMDKSISSFRKCASHHNIHVTLVVHPRKESDGNLLQTASIYGSAKASQEADNVLILQTSDKLSMQVMKNRFSGTIGSIPLCFHSDSLCLSGFHRNVETEEPILPVLKPRRLIQNLEVIKRTKPQ